MSAAANPCAAALAAFRWPDLEGWRGLPDCRLADAGAVFDLADPDRRGSGYLGAQKRPLAWLNASGNGFPEAIRLWLEGDRVVAMDTRLWGSRAQSQHLVRAFGRPDARLDTFANNVALERGEWVYLDSGLSLAIDPETEQLVRITAFRPTDLDTFVRELRFVGGRSVHLRPRRSEGP
jgi:hypothetical protein